MATMKKKVSHLRETFPFLQEEEAEVLLKQNNGSIQSASDAVLNGKEHQWHHMKKTRRPVNKTEPAEDEYVRPFHNNNKREHNKVDRNGREKSSMNRARAQQEHDSTPAPAVNGGDVAPASVNMKTAALPASNYKKGGASFADVLKRQKEVTGQANAQPPVAPILEVASNPPAAQQDKKASPTQIAGKKRRDHYARPRCSSHTC
jgi:hypothetical protein